MLKALIYGASPHRVTVLLRDFEEILGIKNKALPVLHSGVLEMEENAVVTESESKSPEKPIKADARIAMELVKIKNVSEPWSEHFDEVITYYKNILETIEERAEVHYYYQTPVHHNWRQSVKQDIDLCLDLYDEQLPNFEKDTKQQLISNIAYHLSRILDFERAIMVCRRSYDIDPTFSRTRMIHAHCNAFIGKFAEAKEQYEKAFINATTHDERCEILELKGVSHLRLGEIHDAIECFRTSQRISRNLWNSGKVTEGKTCYERAMNNHENLAFTSDIFFLKGKVHLFEGEQDLAELYFTRARNIAHSASLREMISREVPLISGNVS